MELAPLEPFVAALAATADHEALSVVSLTVAIAIAGGMAAQALARHLRLPGIVLLLAAGVVLGPDVLHVVEPSSLGPGLQILVGFAVAVILFDGGLNLSLGRLRREATVIRRLLTLGSAVTAIGGAVAARYLMGWDWRLALLFGTLVIVTGPTVITPLLRRIKVHHRVETVLEAEGVLIDPIGAVIAVVGLSVAMAPSGSNFAQGAIDVLVTIGFGLLAGAAAGVLLALLLRVKRVVPQGLENTLTLSFVLLMFQGSNAVMAESGIATVTAAGLVVGNMRTHTRRELLEFKEQLTTMLIGMLFVLLAADVRLAQVQALGWPGVATVVALMIVVRPINILACTIGSNLSGRERTFLSWLSPRGVVAAAVASLFAQEIAAFDPKGASDLRALVFMTIAITVLVQGLTGGIVAQALGLRRRTDEGTVILGANELGHALGVLLRDHGEDVMFIDANPEACKRVEADDFRVVYGNALEDRTLRRARVEDRADVIALTQAAGVNLMFGRKAMEDHKASQVHIGIGRDQSQFDSTVHDIEGTLLFGRPRDLESWMVRFRKRNVDVEPWKLTRKPEADEKPFEMPESALLPLIHVRGSRARPVHSGLKPRKGDELWFGIARDQRARADEWLAARGFERVPDAPEPNVD